VWLTGWLGDVWAAMPDRGQRLPSTPAAIVARRLNVNTAHRFARPTPTG